MLTYTNTIRRLRKDEILDAALESLNGSNMFYDPGDEVYIMNARYLIRKKMSEILLLDLPILSIEYSVLVRRDVYERLAVAGVNTNQEPPKINEQRVAVLEKARQSMIDIPIKGYEQYAIVHYIIHLKRDEISAGSLIHQIMSPKGMAFLWFDGEKDLLSMPLIRW